MKLLHIAAAGLLALTLHTTTAQAQVNININPPSWGPAAPAGTQYYYLPEVGGYYDLRDQHYVVQRNGKWARVTSVSGYNPNNFHPVVVNYVGAQPWVLINEHKAKYPKAGHPHGMPPGQAKKMRGNQTVIINSPNYEGNNSQGNGKGHGNGKNKGKDKH